MSIRPDWRTHRSDIAAKVRMALAAKDSTCPWCDAEVLTNEPIYLTGVAFAAGPRPSRVDLSTAEWVCGSCIGGAA